jgi:hypothetical protein
MIASIAEFFQSIVSLVGDGIIGLSHAIAGLLK